MRSRAGLRPGAGNGGLGATTVTVTGLDYVIRQDNALIDRLAARLPRDEA